MVMEDWGGHKTGSALWWRNTTLFTDSKADCFEQIHEARGYPSHIFLARAMRNVEIDTDSHDCAYWRR